MDKDSATFEIKTERIICMTGADHSTICKASSRQSQNYRKLEPRMNQLIEEAFEKVKIRDELIKAGDKHAKSELLCNMRKRT